LSTARKRFWSEVSVEAGAEGFAVLLDGRGVRLPGGALLAVPGRVLAEALAGEWRAVPVGGMFSPEDLPLNRMAGTMIERIRPEPERVRETLLPYGLHDALCYREEGAFGLEQAEAYGPWLRWFTERYGARLSVTEGLMPVPQPDGVVAALRGALEALGEADLAGLGVAVPVSGSLVLGLALVAGVVGAKEALEVCSLEERAQMRAWGEDAEIVRVLEGRLADLEVAARFVGLAREE